MDVFAKSIVVCQLAHIDVSMSSDDEEEDRLSLGGLSPRPGPRPPRPRQKTFLGKLAMGRRKSTGQEFLHSTSLPNASPITADPDGSESQGRRVTRSQSNANVLGFKNQWADALVSQLVSIHVKTTANLALTNASREPMQASLIQLRQTVQVYEEQASSERWGELWRVRADVTELDTLAKAVLDKQKPRSTFFKGLERFSTVALEYSKLLDVLMNQCPEYVALAWGVTKLLLVANINHSKLKQNVESHLISIGEQLGLVNQLIAYSPTDKMVEYEATGMLLAPCANSSSVRAVAILYASFSKFLGKALRCYARSKLASVIEAFAFPWEAKFQKVVSQIDAQIRRIQEIASASHFHATLCSQNLLQSLWDRQQEERASSQQDSASDQLRMEIKEEMKREISGLLQNFNTKWVQRFDELLLQNSALLEGRDDASMADPMGSNAQSALQVSTPQVYLADFVSNPQTLLEFRNEAFPQLQRFDHREKYIRAGERLLTTYDWQHCVGLLRHPSMRSWVSSEKSAILWVDTHQGHRLDWASVFSTRLMDDCARLEFSMALAHFCQGHSTGNAVSTAAILIQSLIFKSISLHSTYFTVRAIEMTQQRFQDAQDDVERLWALFLDVLGLVAKGKCVWIIIDHVDILQKETNLRGLENALALLRNLNALTDDPSITVKIFVTARIRDAARLSTKIAEAKILSSRHAIITVPRGSHRSEATLLAKSSKKLSRLPEPKESLEVPTSLVSVDSLLSNTSSDSDYEEERPIKAKHTIKRKPELAVVQNKSDLETGESDSASLFDPFASSDESEPATGSRKAAHRSYSSEDSADGDFSQAEPFGDFAKVKWESTDDEGHVRNQSTSPVTPKIVVAFSDHLPHAGGSRSGSERNGVDTSTEAQPDLSTPKASDKFPSVSHNNSGLSSDSDSDDDSI